jgi:hypothetical protein
MQSGYKKEILGRTLENAFFFRMDQELIAELQRNMNLEEKLQVFQNATGIRDRQQLMGLIDAGFEVSTLTAFTRLPLVFVAWADGNLDSKEKDTILTTLVSKGIAPNTAAMLTNHEWFCKQPDDELWELWQQFTYATVNRQPAKLRNELMDEIVSLCHLVANASGDMFGVSNISAEESRVIDRVAQTLCAYKTA